jgi:hypothetical protein
MAVHIPPARCSDADRSRWAKGAGDLGQLYGIDRGRGACAEAATSLRPAGRRPHCPNTP